MTGLADADDVVDETATAESAVVEEGHWNDLERHLGALTSLQRDVVLLRVVAGMSVAETAGVVQRSQDAVRQLQYRGLRVLEERLERQRFGEPQEG